MRKARFVALLLVCGSLTLAPAGAELFTVALTNGATFDTRYQPRRAAWDAEMIEFVTDTGLWVAMPRGLVSEVRAVAETKGFGKVINTTTVDLGYAPNDLAVADLTTQAQAAERSYMDTALANRQFDQQQFVEPSQAGVHAPRGGIPVTSLGGGGAPSGPAVVPVAQPAPPVAPPPSVPQQ